MRQVVLIALAIGVFSPSVYAQDWTSAPMVSGSITVPGKPTYTRSTPAVVTETMVVCVNVSNGTWFQPPPCPTGQEPRYFTRTTDGVPFSGNIVTRNVTSIPTGAADSNALVGIQVSGAFADPLTPSGISGFTGTIALNAFATSSSVQALSSRVSALEGGNNSYVTAAQLEAVNSRIDVYTSQHTELIEKINRADITARQGIAMATALSLSAPAPGRSNRLAIGTGTFAGESAVSLNYSRQAGQLDLGAAVSFAGDQSLGKASVGFSW